MSREEGQLVRVWVPLIVRVAPEPGDDEMACDMAAEDFARENLRDAIEGAIERTPFYLDDEVPIVTEVVDDENPSGSRIVTVDT